MSTPQGMSLKNCRTRAEAVKRFETWLDAYLENEVRVIASYWSVEDGAECDAPAFLSEVAELRAHFERSRAECVAEFTEALEAFFGPERR